MSLYLASWKITVFPPSSSILSHHSCCMLSLAFATALFAAFFFSRYFCFSLVFSASLGSSKHFCASFFSCIACLTSGFHHHCSFFFRLCVGFPDVRPHISSAAPTKPSLNAVHSASTSSLCSLSSLNFLSTSLLYFSITSPSHFHHLITCLCFLLCLSLPIHIS